MWVPQFWCGVIATMLAEVIALVLIAVISTKKMRESPADYQSEQDFLTSFIHIIVTFLN